MVLFSTDISKLLQNPRKPTDFFVSVGFRVILFIS